MPQRRPPNDAETPRDSGERRPAADPRPVLEADRESCASIEPGELAKLREVLRDFNGPVEGEPNETEKLEKREFGDQQEIEVNDVPAKI